MREQNIFFSQKRGKRWYKKDLINYRMERSLPELQQLKKDLENREKQARELEKEERKEELRQTILVLQKFEADFLRVNEMHCRRLLTTEYQNPGAKPVGEPPVQVPRLFVGEMRILNLFLLNILDRTINKEKIKEKLQELQVPEQYRVGQIIKPPRKPSSAVIKCFNLQTSCQIQCLAITKQLTTTILKPDGTSRAGAIRVVPHEKQDFEQVAPKIHVEPSLQK